MLAVTAILGLVVVLVAVTVAGRRVKRPMLQVEATCLLCDSPNLQVLAAPQYRCRACGFDTRRVGPLGNELERFRDLTTAIYEFDFALRTLRGLPPGPGDERLNEVTKHQMAGYDTLRTIVLTEHRLLDPPFASDDDLYAFDLEQATRAQERYLKTVHEVREELRQQILVTMTADGDPTVVPPQPDFEHVVQRDYEALD